jgi:hypothetical protein
MPARVFGDREANEVPCYVVSIFYPATLKTATGSVTINVDPSRITSSRETKILEAA